MWMLKEVLTPTESFGKSFYRRYYLSLDINNHALRTEKQKEESISGRQKIKRVGRRKHADPKDLKKV